MFLGTTNRLTPGYKSGSSLHINYLCYPYYVTFTVRNHLFFANIALFVMTVAVRRGSSW